MSDRLKEIKDRLANNYLEGYEAMSDIQWLISQLERTCESCIHFTNDVGEPCGGYDKYCMKYHFSWPDKEIGLCCKYHEPKGE